MYLHRHSYLPILNNTPIYLHRHTTNSHVQTSVCGPLIEYFKEFVQCLLLLVPLILPLGQSFGRFGPPVLEVAELRVVLLHRLVLGPRPHAGPVVRDADLLQEMPVLVVMRLLDDAVEDSLHKVVFLRRRGFVEHRVVLCC